MRIFKLFCQFFGILIVFCRFCENSSHLKPNGYDNDCYRLINREIVLPSESDPIPYICKKTEEYHYIEVWRDEKEDIRFKFSKKQIKITFLYDGLIKLLIKNNLQEEWQQRSFVFDSADKAVKFYLEVEPSGNPRMKFVSTINDIHAFIRRSGKKRSRSPTVSVAHPAVAYGERFNSQTIITIKSGEKDGPQKPLVVFSKEDFALSQTEKNMLTLFIEGHEAYYILIFDDDKQAQEFYQYVFEFTNIRSEVPLPHMLLGNPRNCYALEKIEPALKTESKGVKQHICGTIEGWNIVSVLEEKEEIIFKVEESQNKIIFMNDGMMKFSIKKDSNEKSWTLSCTFKFANDATKFYFETEPEPENNPRMKLQYEVKQLQKLVKRAHRKSHKMSLRTIAQPGYFYKERFNAWTIITIRSEEYDESKKSPIVFSSGDFALSKVVNENLVWFVNGNSNVNYILRFENEKQANEFREIFKIFASTESEQEIPNDVKNYVSNNLSRIDDISRK